AMIRCPSGPHASARPAATSTQAAHTSFQSMRVSFRGLSHRRRHRAVGTRNAVPGAALCAMLLSGTRRTIHAGGRSWRPPLKMVVYSLGCGVRSMNGESYETSAESINDVVDCHHEDVVPHPRA